MIKKHQQAMRESEIKNKDTIPLPTAENKMIISNGRKADTFSKA